MFGDFDIDSACESITHLYVHCVSTWRLSDHEALIELRVSEDGVDLSGRKLYSSTSRWIQSHHALYQSRNTPKGETSQGRISITWKIDQGVSELMAQPNT